MLLAVFISSLASASEKPQRIVSLSLCTDELVIALAQKDHIAAVTYLAQDDRYSRYAKEAEPLRTHHNQVEEIIGFNPDLIVGLDFEVGKTSALLKRLGYRIHQFPSPTRLVEVDAVLKSMGQLLREEKKAEQLSAEFHEQLNTAKREIAPSEEARVLVYGPNGYSAGSLSIKSDLLRFLGLRPLSDAIGQTYDGILPVASALRFDPEWVIIEMESDTHSLAHRYLQHPALAAWFSRPEKVNRQIRMPNKLWLCAGLGLGDAAKHLASAVR